MTFEGLGEQLLTLVVEAELPEVMRRKTGLMMQLDKDKRTLQGLEDEILRLLSESQGNILDDEVLISTLQQSKVTAKDIEQRVADAEVGRDGHCEELSGMLTSRSPKLRLRLRATSIYL